MGSSLRPVLANIIMTELDRVIAESLLTSGKSKFYVQYVSDTLLFFYYQKKRALFFISDKLICKFINSFHKNLKFTTDRFDKNYIHFLEIAIDKNKTDLYYKAIHLIATFHGIIKFHGLNPFITKQRKFVHQAKSLGSKLRRSKYFFLEWLYFFYT